MLSTNKQTDKPMYVTKNITSLPRSWQTRIHLLQKWVERDSLWRIFCCVLLPASMRRRYAVCYRQPHEEDMLWSFINVPLVPSPEPGGYVWVGHAKGLGSFFIGGGGGGLAKSIGKKKSAPPCEYARKKSPPPWHRWKIFDAPPPHVLKTCLYVAVVLPQQL